MHIIEQGIQWLDRLKLPAIGSIESEQRKLAMIRSGIAAVRIALRAVSFGGPFDCAPGGPLPMASAGGLRSGQAATVGVRPRRLGLPDRVGSEFVLRS